MQQNAVQNIYWFKERKKEKNRKRGGAGHVNYEKKKHFLRRADPRQMRKRNKCFLGRDQRLGPRVFQK